MGLFTRGTPPPRRPVEQDDDERLDPQGMALELLDAYTERDDVGLAALTPQQRAEQAHARKVLYDFIDAMWEDAKDRGVDPAIRPEWNGVAGMRDIAMSMWTRAVSAQDVDHQD